MTIGQLPKRGQRHTEIAPILCATQGAVHLRRAAAGASDWRARQVQLAEGWTEAIGYWLETAGEDGPVNLPALHAWLVAEHDYPGSLRSVWRYFCSHYPKPRHRARQQVETPPGAQAQADWAEYRRLMIGGRSQTEYCFHLQLSWSRFGAAVWSPRKDQLSWQRVHNEAFRRLEGIPATAELSSNLDGPAAGANSTRATVAIPGRCASTSPPVRPSAPRPRARWSGGAADPRQAPVAGSVPSALANFR